MGFLNLDKNTQKRFINFEKKVAAMAKANGLTMALFVSHIGNNDELNTWITGNTMVCDAMGKYHKKIEKTLLKAYKKVLKQMKKEEARLEREKARKEAAEG